MDWHRDGRCVLGDPDHDCSHCYVFFCFDEDRTTGTRSMRITIGKPEALLFSQKPATKVRGKTVAPVRGVRGMDERQVGVVMLCTIDLKWLYLRQGVFQDNQDDICPEALFSNVLRPPDWCDIFVVR